MNETPTRLAAPSPAAASQGASTPEALGIPSFETMDRLGRAVTARMTQGISPHALYAAWFDWASHLANAPGRLVELGLEAVNIGARFARFATHSLSENVKLPFEPQAGDRRFGDGLWKRPPYSVWQQAFLAQEAWWRSATREVRGMTPKNAARISFITRQLLDVWSPSNVPWAQPGGHRDDADRARRQSHAWRAQSSGRYSGARSPCSPSLPPTDWKWARTSPSRLARSCSATS